MNINYVVFSEYEQQRGEELIEYMREKNYKKQQEELEKQQEELEKQQEELEKQQEKLEKQQEELKKQQEELKKATSKKENEFIKTMLKNKKKYTYEDISELTGKNIDEIKKIENQPINF